MIPRIESFDVPHLRNLWIEDFEDGKPNHSALINVYIAGLCNRFRVWSGGVNIGNVGTIGEARSVLHSFAEQTLQEKQENYKENLREVEQALTKLGDVNHCLLRFKCVISDD